QPKCAQHERPLHAGLIHINVRHRPADSVAARRQGSPAIAETDVASSPSDFSGEAGFAQRAHAWQVGINEYF
ncbi:MAG: hypothetical protein ACXWCW_18845, partial [Burkholderiales bacterium]